MKTVTAPLSRSQAQAIVDRVHRAIGSTGAALKEAKDREAWKALGYPSWADLLWDEFGIKERQARYLVQRSDVESRLTEAAGGKILPRLTLAQSAAVARGLDAVTAAVQAEPERVAEIVAAASHPASHPPLDGDRSTHPAPEVPPAPSSRDRPSDVAIAAAELLGSDDPERDARTLEDAAAQLAAGVPRETVAANLAAEPSEPGVAGAPSLIPTPGSATVTIHGASTGTNADAPQVWFPPPNLCTDPAHADLLGLIRDLDRLLLPRDEEDWRLWDLGDQEPEGRALMVKVRSLLGDAGTAQDADETMDAADAAMDAQEEREEARRIAEEEDGTTPEFRAVLDRTRKLLEARANEPMTAAAISRVTHDAPVLVIQAVNWLSEHEHDVRAEGRSVVLVR